MIFYVYHRKDSEPMLMQKRSTVNALTKEDAAQIVLNRYLANGCIGHIVTVKCVDYRLTHKKRK